MELKLQHHEHAIHDTAAAFIRGAQPRAWLQAVDNLGVDPRSLRCFIIPEKHDPSIAAGLFVIFPGGEVNTSGNLIQPYGVIGNRLYIPANASLLPAISQDEFSRLLIWPCQVFHPAYGFFGWEEKDAIQLENLLIFRQANSANWDFARMGNLPVPPLRSIHIQQVTAEDIFNDVKNEINSKSLRDLKPEKETTFFSKLQDNIKAAVLKAGIRLMEAMASSGGTSFGGNGAGKLFTWMQDKLANIEQRRQKEMQRLLELLENNPDEGLKYAIPLSDEKYMPRGTDNSSVLGRRNTNFRLTGLGGGTAAGWNIADGERASLREKYIAAAQRAKEQKDFRKAAYIYAHLLKDFHNAAAVLKEGKHYHEAAVLYKDHLNNLRSAAACYEQGGMFPEAIELYTSLHHHEKAGDLYILMGREEAGMQCYDIGIEKNIALRNYIEASRLAGEKKKDVPAAKNLLLEGWKLKQNAASCLHKYFAISDKDNLSGEIQMVYDNHTPAPMRALLFEVLKTQRSRRNDQQVKDTCTRIAYELVSRELQQGQTHLLRSLNTFLPEDDLLARDTARYINQPNNYTMPVKPTSFQLDKTVNWRRICSLGNHWLAAGYTQDTIHIARGNWTEQVSYFTLTVNNITNSPEFEVYTNTSSDKVILYAPMADQFHPFITEDTILQLPRLTITPAVWADQDSFQLACNADDGHLFQLNGKTNAFTLNEVMINENEPAINQIVSYTYPEDMELQYSYSVNMVSVGDKCYFGYGPHLFGADNQGIVGHWVLHAVIRKITVLHHSPLLLAVSVTGEGTVYLVGEHTEMQTLPSPNSYVIDTCYLNNNLLAVAYAKSVSVFNIEKGLLQAELHSDAPVIQLMRGPLRNQVAVLDNTCLITIHQVEE